jgi:uncharacterized repeat protein (TIGR03803 family)
MKTFTVIVIGTLVTGFAGAALCQTESVIYNFKPGYTSSGKLLLDTNNDLVGPTGVGPGASGGVFRMKEHLGKWSERNVYSFGGYSGDGSDPQSSLVQDANGTYYGTTYMGGAYGKGTIYSLALKGGQLIESVLYNFTAGSDGGLPIGKILYDKTTAALYGTTSVYGQYDCGTVFQLVQSGGQWALTTLHSFQGGGGDGCNPENGMHLGVAKGTLLGTTRYQGSGGFGTVYLLKERAGVWSEESLYSFTGGNDGANPEDLDINTDTKMAYGVTNSGGTLGDGVVFSLNITGRPVETVLHSFAGGSDGLNPIGLHLEADTGNLFGVCLHGGLYAQGTVFELIQNGNNWNESVFYNFGSHANDGAYPVAAPSENTKTGTLYGSTSSGGRYGDGTVWSITQ